jgi:MFS family permease
LHWSAVIAGVFLAIAAHIVMGLVGMAIGLAAEPADSTEMGAAAAIWALATPFVATLLGAWLACRMADAQDERSAYVHGILVWCIGLVAGALFLTGTLATGAMTAGATASGNVGPAERMIRQEAGTRPGAARTEEATRKAAAGTGGAALAAIAGILGAVVGAGLSRRRSEGKGTGWRIAIQRPRHEGRGAGPAPGAQPRRPGAAPPDLGPPSDPYHH